ncbi:twin-arginine translocation signal domain-containing protein [Noviherbaspirillum galbum]|uniref:Twin-arginine translocation signal domain-containing protein n=1 Tax=Noviherbaspirillum galbum TaxID=2709383 RepID=A0A6B3STY1_9BURK|nr:twin-arginine translocation signal domain-containing protein [Noviherbaspirillum galbum]NEX61822.1 twin-arginine translocation signal domain-containing protein [Noviherbaspirillum galbum]
MAATAALPISRRSFLKTGLIGALALATAGGVHRMSRPVPMPTPFVLDPAGRDALSAIIPAILGDAIQRTPADIRAATERTLGAIAGLPLATQKEIQDLFALLTLAPSRRFLAGLGDDWSEAKPEDVAAFLQRWRTHRLGLFQSAYHALHDLVAGAWYADESTWASIGYPGPLKELS